MNRQDSTDHIRKIAHAFATWFDKDNRSLSMAIEQTVDEKLFHVEDVKHQIRALKQSIREETLKRWVSASDTLDSSDMLDGSSVLDHTDTLEGSNVLDSSDALEDSNSLGSSGGMDGSSNKKRVLCLHAGNLPMVGIQDLLAVLLRNGIYTGKLSRKDPYLMDSLLRHLSDHDLVGKEQWSVTLEGLQAGIENDLKVDSPDLPGEMKHRGVAEALLFAGSRQSAGPVKEKLKKLNLIDHETPLLMRTAGFSIAYIEDELPETMRDLTEAIFRYGGAGCRSVAIVVSPFPLRKVRCEFTDYIESFWLKNPPEYKVLESVTQRFATNKAVGIDQAWLDHFLIEESAEISAEKHIAHWIPGDFYSLEKIVTRMGDDLQSVYSTADYIGKRVGDNVVEPLSTAQRPPIWWRPDNIDTLRWLKKHGI